MKVHEEGQDKNDLDNPDLKCHKHLYEYKPHIDLPDNLLVLEE